jgi:hypothetical protein
VSQFGDGETCEVHESEWRKARKPHQCHACHETIAPGQRYHRTFYVFDGDPDYVIRCARCQALFRHLSVRIAESGESDEFCDGELNCGHTYQERWDEDPTPEIAALAFWRPGDPLLGGKETT